MPTPTRSSTPQRAVDSLRTRALAPALVAFSLMAGAAPTRAQPPARAATLDSTALTGMTYRMLGPYRGGRSTAVAGIADQPHVFLMGTTGGGVWRTDDAGHTWRNISDGYFGGGIGAIAVAASDPNVVYVGEGSVDIRGNTSQGRGAWRSTDGGRSWSSIGLRTVGQIGRIVVHPQDPDLVYVAALGRPFGRNAERGVYRSRDGGKTWARIHYLNDSTGAVDLAMNPRNPRILYAAMWRAERKPWTLISGSTEGGIWRSTDGGDTWTKLTVGLPSGPVGKIGLTVSAANPDRLWALVEAEPDGGLFRSDDAGNTWRRVNSDNALRQRAWYYTHVRADPDEEHVVYALNTSLLRSIDGGVTFTPIPVPHGDVHDLWINPRDKRVMAVADDGGAQVSLNRGQTWSTYWNQPTAEFYDVITDRRFPYRVYTAQQDNTTIAVPAWSSPHALHPFADYRFAAGCETGPVALNPDDPSVIWGGCYGGAINRWDTRTDERRNVVAYPQLQLGQAAKDLTYRFQWVAPILVSRHDPQVVYHGAQYVLRTRDEGRSWERISPDLTTDTPAHQEASGGPINNDITGVEIFNTVFALAEDPRDARVLWAGTDDGRVHVTRDGGTSWREVTPPGMPRFGTVEEIVVSAHAANRVYVAVQAYRLDDFRPYVFRSDDGGRTWTRIADGTNGIPADHPVRSFGEDPVVADLLYAGTEYGLFVSIDAGRRWHRMPGRLPITPIADLEVRQDDLVMATQGRSIWIVDDLSALRQLDANVTAAAAHLFRPADAPRVQRGVDPFDPPPTLPDQPGTGAALHYWLGRDATEPVTLEIRDARGQRIRTLTSDSAASRKAQTPPLATKRGLHRVLWDFTAPGPTPLDSAVIWGFLGGVPVPPGEYTVALAANGMRSEQTLRVLPDPRRPDLTPEAYVAQYRAAMTIRDSLESVLTTLRDLRDVRRQATAMRGAADRIGVTSALAAPLDTLGAHLAQLEAALNQTRSRSGQDPIRFAGKLDNQWAELYGIVAGPDGYISGGPEGPPTAGATQRLNDLAVEWERWRQLWLQIVDKDIGAVNAAARQHELGTIQPPPQRRIVP